MKNDKKWLKESVNELKTIFNGMKMGEYETGRLDGYSHVSMLIDYLEEPEVPVIPQFVADFIEKWKNEGLTMSEWFEFNYDDEDEDQNKVFKWLYDNDYKENTKRELMMVDTIRYGYEIEKEKRYRVIFPTPGRWNHRMAIMSNGANYYIEEITDPDYEGAELTEAEIKAIDERYWAFRKPVEEFGK